MKYFAVAPVNVGTPSNQVNMCECILLLKFYSTLLLFHCTNHNKLLMIGFMNNFPIRILMAFVLFFVLFFCFFFVSSF